MIKISFCLLIGFLLILGISSKLLNEVNIENDEFFKDNKEEYSEEKERVIMEINDHRTDFMQDNPISDEEILKNLNIIEEEINNEYSGNIRDENRIEHYSTDEYSNKRSKILFIPATINSHVLMYGQVGQQLAKLGHQVEILVGSCIPDFFNNNKNKNFVATKYKVERNVSILSSDAISTSFLNIALSKSVWYQYYTIFNMEFEVNSAFENDCRGIIFNEKLMRYLELENFDFVITDPIAIHCYNIIPLKLNIPYGILSLPFIANIYGVPRLPSITPFIGMASTDNMSFFERLSSFIQEIIYYFAFEIECTDCKKVLPNNIKHPSGTQEMLKRASTWFFMEDLTITYPAANQPNTISMGSMLSSAIESKPLPQDLEDFVKYHNDGTILVSFGSYFDNVPEYLGNVFCRVFQSRPKNKIIWKMKYTPIECKTLTNLKIVPWFPQIDVLAHPKTILFITHGGFNSIVEALHHQVPMIVIPIAMDQKTNAIAIENKGYAIAMELGSDNLEEELNTAIETIITEDSYRKYIKKYSVLLREKSARISKEVSGLIDHIVEFGDEHLRSSAIDMPLLEVFMFDIYLFFTAIFVVFFIFFFFILFYFCRRMNRMCFKKMKTA